MLRGHFFSQWLHVHSWRHAYDNYNTGSADLHCSRFYAGNCNSFYTSEAKKIVRFLARLYSGTYTYASGVVHLSSYIAYAQNEKE